MTTRAWPTDEWTSNERASGPSNRRASCRMEGRVDRGTDMMGVAEVWRGQPFINNARKMPSAEGVLRALARALVLEGGKI